MVEIPKQNPEEPMNLIHIEKVKTNREAFATKVLAISKELGINPNWLMQAMNSESGLNHQAVNPTGGATGLIQFMPATAKGLGTSTEALKAMTNVAQLDYVFKYLKPWKGRMKSYADTYMAIFFPAAIGKSRDYVLETKNLKADTIATQNRIFDLNKDKKITKGEFEDFIMRKVPKEWLEHFKTGAVVGLSIVGVVSFFLSQTI
jgi:hypothetical protein